MKHQTPASKLLLLLGAVALTWTACKQAENRDDIDYEQAKHHIIPIKQAIAYQNQFLKTYDTTLRRMVGDTFLAKHFRIPNAETFNRNAIELLLHQHPRPDSIRIYYGIDSLGGMQLVIMGVDKNGKNIYSSLLQSKTAAISVPGVSSAKAQGGLGGDTSALENGQTCPPCLITP